MDKQLWPQAAGGLETLPETQGPGCQPEKHKRALSPQGALGNAVASLVTFTECLVLLCQGLF